MPLSEEELRLLEQMERALVQEDPKLASTLRGTTFRRSARRRAILGGIGFFVGIGLLMAGAITQIYPVGILGFVVMLGAATLALTAMRGQQAMAEPAEARETRHHGFGVVDGGRLPRPHRPRRSSGSSSSSSFMERMEERWRRRRETGGW